MASDATVATVAIFDAPGLTARAQKFACWGASPNPAFGPTWPEAVASLCSLWAQSLTLLFLLFARLCVAQPIINIGLGGCHFLHFLFGLSVRRIELLFLVGQLAAILPLWLCPSGWVQTRAWCPGNCAAANSMPSACALSTVKSFSVPSRGSKLIM